MDGSQSIEESKISAAEAPKLAPTPTKRQRILFILAGEAAKMSC